MNVHFSSQKQDWATPQALFNSIAAEHGPFDLDVCATAANAKCGRYFDSTMNGLSPLSRWAGTCWMNPPYGREIGKWVEKAAKSVNNGPARKVVCLLPARTDTRWWNDWVVPFGQVKFIRGRIKFEGAEHNAPFPSAIVVFEP